LNITCNFLYCNHQVHRDFLITLYYTFVASVIQYAPPPKVTGMSLMTFDTEEGGPELEAGEWIYFDS